MRRKKAARGARSLRRGLGGARGRGSELYIQLSMLGPESYSVAGGALCIFTTPSPAPDRVNEDCACVIPCGRSRGFFAVADGMGGCPDGEQASKIQAAAWAQQELPEWSATIEKAIAWRRASRQPGIVDHAATLPETRRFVAFIIDRILG